ncbi:MAG TPA: phage tail protein [Prolixibacteraceae bacterium]|nr:phage tail protein [Prolixibacteraceae bacterium]HPS13938.1 phage tail protein [Prolixibacteraceae bacterium]
MADSTTTYPLPAFHFKVVFTSDSGSVDTSFQDVSGLSYEMGTEDVEEGGESRYVHKLPKATKHGNIVLKRAITSNSSPLVKWCIAVLEGDRSELIVTTSLLIHLLDEKHNPVRTWTLNNAYPVKWTVEAFNSTKNEVAIETIELAYNTLIRSS